MIGRPGTFETDLQFSPGEDILLSQDTPRKSAETGPLNTSPSPSDENERQSDEPAHKSPVLPGLAASQSRNLASAGEDVKSSLEHSASRPHIAIKPAIPRLLASATHDGSGSLKNSRKTSRLRAHMPDTKESTDADVFYVAESRGIHDGTPKPADIPPKSPRRSPDNPLKQASGFSPVTTLKMAAVHTASTIPIQTPNQQAIQEHSPQGVEISGVTAETRPDQVFDQVGESNGLQHSASSERRQGPSKRQTPGKLDTGAKSSARNDHEAISKVHTPPGRSDIAALGVSRAADTAASTSHFATPTVPVGSPIKRSTQPRTIRVVCTSKSENHLPGGVTSVASTVPPPSSSTRAASRQPSITSIHQPGTPASEPVSDNASITSRSVSRANSPPPITTMIPASFRSKTKTQLKKDKQGRAKSSTEENEPKFEGDIKRADETVQGPLLSRKKKAKKLTNVAVASDQGQNLLPSPAEGDQTEGVSEHSSKTKPPPSSGLYPGTATEGNEALGSHRRIPITAASVIADVQARSERSLDCFEFFKVVAGLNYRHEITHLDLVNRDRSFQFGEEDVTKLDKHETIRFGGEDDRLSSRGMITSTGAYLRGLSRHQEDRFLELEERIAADRAPTRFHFFKDPCVETMFPAVIPSSEALDFKTSALSPSGPYTDEAQAYNDQFVLPVIPQIPNQGSDVLKTGTLSSTFRLHALGDAFRSVFTADGNTVNPNLTVNKAQQSPAVASLLSVEEAETAMLKCRKETEALEKRLNGLIKKNKRLVFGSGP